MKKVILLAPVPPPVGGIAIWTNKMLASKIIKEKVELEVVDEKIIGKRDVFGDKTKRNIFDEIKRTKSIWKNLREKLKDKEVIAVHSNIPATSFSMLREYICAIITKKYKRKFIIHFRCTVPNMVNSKCSLFILKKLCSISDEIIVLNKKSYDFIKGISNTHIDLIPNFVDINEINYKKNINSHIRTVLYVGGVIEEKGCDDIVEVAKSFPDVQFRLVGNSNKYLKIISKDMPNVILTGVKNRNEVKREYSNADVFLFLTRYSGEGFSNSLVEAMASGIPCIATDWSANFDMLENKGGVIVKIRDIRNVIQAINDIDDMNVRKKMSEWNINKVKNNYVENIILEKYLKVYENMQKD